MRVRSAWDGDVGAIRRVSLAAGQPEADSGADAGYVAFLRTSGTVLVAAVPDGTVAGWGAVKPIPLGALLSDLFVDPAWQGRGVGTELLRARFRIEDYDISMCTAGVMLPVSSVYSPGLG